MKKKLKQLFVIIAIYALMGAMFTAMLVTWAKHPAERPVNGHEYLEELRENVAD